MREIASRCGSKVGSVLLLAVVTGYVGLSAGVSTRWQISNGYKKAVFQCMRIVAGSRVRLTADWGKLHAGEELEMLRVDGPGLIVCPVAEDKDKEKEKEKGKKEEFWIPASLVANSSMSRAWSFRPRRIDSSEGENVHLPQDAHAEENGPPTILTIPCSIRATAGGVARLVLEARRVERALVRWRKEGQPCDIQAGDRYRLFRTTDSLCLEIAPCLPSDSGVYHCRVQHETASCSATIPLSIVGIDTTNAWNHTDTVQSDPQNHFAGQYVELEELGVGRFARVCRATERDRETETETERRERERERGRGGTEREVALKQISRAKQSLSLTHAEYHLLRTIRHDNIVRAFALFEDTPQPDVDTIVLELVRGCTLLAYLGERIDYTEAIVAKYTGQLLSALQWLHSRKRVHLDLKPENVLVDKESDMIKLIDLGEAVRAVPLDEVVPPVDLEFAAPESVLGKPTGSYTDMWAAGVFLYALLSGLSPFLDDSIEETTTNILKCDFCFPEEYFKEISSEVKSLLERLLRLRGEHRATAEATLLSPWFKISSGATIPSSRMAAFIDRRAHRSKSHQDRSSSFYS